MSLDDLKEKANGYVFQGTMLDAPYIDVNLYNITEEELNSAVNVYLENANEYASSFPEALGVRDYVIDRFQKDLAGECIGLTSGGINKQANTVVMHIKSDDVYALATKNLSPSYEGNIITIIDNYGEIHSAVCMNDEHTEPSLQPIYIEPENDDYTYDKKAITVEFAEQSALFINDNPGYIGTYKTYTAYSTDIDENTHLCVNTPTYTVGHYNDIEIGSDTFVTGWFVHDAADNIVVAYSETLEGPYTAIEEMIPSSESEEDESSEEPSGESSEESSEEPSSEPSGEPSEEPSETESSESESSEEP